MKRKLIGLLSLILLLNGAACQQKKTASEKVVLRYVSYEYMPSQVVIHKTIVDRFNKSQDRIFVKLEIAERGIEKILTQIAGGDAPDVFLWFSAHVYDLAKKNALLELTPFMEISDIKTGDYFTGLFDLLKTNLDGKLYVFPISWGAEALAYNKGLFDEAGLSYPDDSWTWEDFVSAAQRLTIEKDGRVVQYGTTLPMEHIVLLSFGAKRFDDKLTRCTLDSPEAGKAFQFLMDVVNKKIIPSLTALPRREQYQIAMDMFMTGKIAMYIVSSNQLENLKILKGFQWDIAPIPRYNGNKRLSAPGVNTLAIYSGTKHPGEAWEFVKFACSEEGQTLLGRNCIPAHKKVTYEYVLVPPPEHIKVIIDQYEELTAFSEGYAVWGREFLENVYNAELDKMLLGLQPVDKTIENMVREGNKFIEG